MCNVYQCHIQPSRWDSEVIFMLFSGAIRISFHSFRSSTPPQTLELIESICFCYACMHATVHAYAMDFHEPTSHWLCVLCNAIDGALWIKRRIEIRFCSVWHYDNCMIKNHFECAAIILFCSITFCTRGIQWNVMKCILVKGVQFIGYTSMARNKENPPHHAHTHTHSTISSLSLCFFVWFQWTKCFGMCDKEISNRF